MEEVKKRCGARVLSVAMAGALVAGMMPGLAYAAPDALAAGQLAAQGGADSISDWAALYGGRGQGTTDTFTLSQVNSLESAATLGDGTVVASGVKAVRTSDDKKNEWDACLVFYDAKGNQLRESVFASQATDGFEKVIEAKDGSIVAVGYAGNGDGAFEGVVSKTGNSGNSDYDAVICKVDPKTGEMVKAAAFGGTGKDMFRDVVELDDGSFVAVGYESSQDGDMEGISKTKTRDALVVRFSSDLSEHSVIDVIGGDAAGMEEARSVIAGIGGGFAVAGTGYSDSGDFAGLIKANKKGDWFLATYSADATPVRTGLAMYGGTADDWLMGVDYDYQGEAGFSDSASGYVLVGYGKSTDGDFAALNGGGSECAALMRVAADGTLKEVVGIGSADRAFAEEVMSFNGGYLVAGYFTGTLSAGDASISSEGSEDAFACFVSKRDGAYATAPIRSLGGAGVDKVRSAALGTGANMLVTGYTRSDEFEGVEAAPGTKSSAFVCSVDLAKLLPESICATVEGATVPFGSSATPLIKKSVSSDRAYTVPVSLMNASSDSPSMAAGMFANSGSLSLDAEGNATLRVVLGAVMGGFASDFKVYDGTNTKCETIDAMVVATRKDANGNEVPLVIDIPVPAAAKDGDFIYLNMFVGLMNSRVDARLKVDYANAALAEASDFAAAQAVSERIAKLPSSDAVTLDDEPAIEQARASYDALTDAQKPCVHAVGLVEAEKAIDALKQQDQQKKTIAYVAMAAGGKATYTGSAIEPAVTVKAADGSIISAENYRVDYVNNKNAGTATVVVTGKGAYAGTARTTFEIAKAPAKASVVKSKTIKAKKLKSKKARFAAVSLKTDGKASFKVVKADRKKVLSFKKGKVTVKKRAKAGTYSLCVRVSAKAGANYAALPAKTYVIKVKVK